MTTEHCLICHKPLTHEKEIPVCSKECEERMELEIIHNREYKKAIAEKADALIDLIRKEKP